MRILLITMVPPWPTQGGARQRTGLLHRALSEHGVVDTLVLSRTSEVLESEHRRTLEERFGLIDCLAGTRVGEERPWRWLASLGAGIPDRVAHLLAGWQSDYQPGTAARAAVAEHLARRSYDLIVSRYLWPAAHAGVLGRHPLIVDVDDLESERLESQASSSNWGVTKRLWWSRRVQQIAAAERRLLTRADHVWLTKRQDAAAAPAGRSSQLPNVPFVEDNPSCLLSPDEEASRRIVFVGSLDYAINVRAVDRFVARAWPHIHRVRPEVKFHIVGNRMAEADRARWAAVPGVVPVGFVDEIRDAYRDAALSVVPIWEGAGTKIKVLESLLFGRTVVAASHALRGYEQHLLHEDSVWVADDDAALAAGCLRLLDDAARRDQMAHAGRRQVIEHYSPASFRDRVRQTIELVVGCGAAGGAMNGR